MKLFWFLFGFDALMSLIPIYFFFVGLGDGTITMKNMGIWLIILLVIAGVLFGSHWLMLHDHLALAKGILGFASIPGLIFLLYIAIVIIGKPRWN